MLFQCVPLQQCSLHPPRNNQQGATLKRNILKDATLKTKHLHFMKEKSFRKYISIQIMTSHKLHTCHPAPMYLPLNLGNCI